MAWQMADVRDFIRIKFSRIAPHQTMPHLGKAAQVEPQFEEKLRLDDESISILCDVYKKDFE